MYFKMQMDVALSIYAPLNHHAVGTVPRRAGQLACMLHWAAGQPEGTQAMHCRGFWGGRVTAMGRSMPS